MIMTLFKNLVQARCYYLLVIVILLCAKHALASNYFAYVHGKEPIKQSGKPLTVFRAKLLRLCELYARGQRAQERLMAMDGDGRAGIARRLEDPPQICRPVLIQLATVDQTSSIGSGDEINE